MRGDEGSIINIIIIRLPYVYKFLSAKGGREGGKDRKKGILLFDTLNLANLVFLGSINMALLTKII